MRGVQEWTRDESSPLIIQGGMGAGVSNWRLAQAVSRLGQLGVVSGTALDQILARRLQDGDPGGHMRRGLDAFPFSRDGRADLAASITFRAARASGHRICPCLAMQKTIRVS